MLYDRLSLNGTWKMGYATETYASEQCPSFKGEPIPNAVPGYWEDMTRQFLRTRFHGQMLINPEYGLRRYPMAGDCPDMALPNIMGNFFYEKSFEYIGPTTSAVLHFGGVQSAVSVWLNGVFVGRHEGYSAPFDLVLPSGALQEGENTVVMSVSNHRLEGFDGMPISGITSRAACEYSGGLSGGVEIRVFRSPLRDAAVIISSDLTEARVSLAAEEDVTCAYQVLDGETVLKEGAGALSFVIPTDGLQRWSPESPKLYTLRILCGDAALERSFGVRRLTVDGVHMRLNGRPYYLRGVCEHCYYPETVQPTHDITYYRGVVKKYKELGFNFCRFHTHIPPEEYMQAADELGLLLHVESPDNVTLAEWRDIVAFCRRHPSVVIYCCGNELQLYDAFLAHIHKCADIVHESTDALFSPMSALRGLEYFLIEEDQKPELASEPFDHHPRRFAYASTFSDVYSSYSLGDFSYNSVQADPEKVESWRAVYNKPRLTHEICIDGTYTDLALKDRYRGTRIGATEMFSSLEEHLAEKGLLKRAPLYFRNSCEWQRRVRKHCFEAVRRCDSIAGYDFLGPIDTHWHTFGYDVGMMNEFYELKPGESARNVRMYNAETVLLNDLDKKINFASGEELSCRITCSYFGEELQSDARLTIRLTLDGALIDCRQAAVSRLPVGQITDLTEYRVTLPTVTRPGAMKLSLTLDAGATYAENEWELYLFPIAKPAPVGELLISDGMSEKELLTALDEGKDVVIFGTKPFAGNLTTFRIALAGRTSGNLATVIEDHPIFADMPHEGYCGWQFCGMLEDGYAVIMEGDGVPFAPIIDVASSHKNIIRQAALFELRALNGRLLVCSLNFRPDDPGAAWLKNRIIAYANSDIFAPRETISREALHAMICDNKGINYKNTNFACNPNDIASQAKRK